jgi:hypothetical protein
MIYRQNTIWNRPIPRVFGIFILLSSLLTIFWLSRNVVLFGAKAALGNTPKNIQISNITNKSLTVSYVTDEAVNGTLNYGPSTDLGAVAFDTRDTDSPTPRKTHYVTIDNLTPDTKYFFSIASGDSVFQNDTVPYEATTAKTVPDEQSVPSEIAISGNVTLDGNIAPEEAIAYLKTADSQIISSLLKPNGNYELKIGTLWKADLSEQILLNPKSKLSLRIIDPTLESTISFLANEANPVPPIILSKDYDFILGELSSISSSGSAKITGFPIIPGSEVASTDPVILTPKTNEKFTDQQPLFQGKAPPGSDIEILIESSHEITTSVQADENGTWQFRPDTKLEPGEHKITIKALDTNGILKTLTRSFTVNAQGSQFTEPSVEPTPTTLLTPTPTPTRTLPTATPLPTATAAPTLTPTLAPTAIVIVPTGVQVTAPDTSPTPNITTPPIPDSGSTALIFGITGISILVGIGSLLFFLL